MAQYMVKDSDQHFVTDSAQIEYLKFNNMRHVILGCMLGDFNDSGVYVVDPKIVEELIKMPKFVVDTVDNVEICHSALKLDKQISFLITYEGNRATLTLAEKINYQANFKLNSGLYSNVNEYILDRVETSGIVDKNVLYKRWNISAFGGETLDVFDMDEETLAKYLNIVNRFKHLLKSNELLLSREAEMEAVEVKYATSVLEMLKHYPQLKEVVEKTIKTTLNEKQDFIRFDKPYHVKTINEIVDTAIKNNLNVLPEQEKAMFDAEYRQVVQEYNIDARRVLTIDEVETRNEVTGQVESVVTQLHTSNLGNITLQEAAKEFAEERTRWAEKYEKGELVNKEEQQLRKDLGIADEIKKEQAEQEKEKPVEVKKPNLVSGAGKKVESSSESSSSGGGKKAKGESGEEKKKGGKTTYVVKPISKFSGGGGAGGADRQRRNSQGEDIKNLEELTDEELRELYGNDAKAVEEARVKGRDDKQEQLDKGQELLLENVESTVTKEEESLKGKDNLLSEHEVGDSLGK